MINSSTSTVRKYQFFEEVESESKENKEIFISHQDSPLENTPITLNDIKPNSIDQMCAIDDIIFVNGKAIHKIQGTLARESVINGRFFTKEPSTFQTLSPFSFAGAITVSLVKR